MLFNVHYSVSRATFFIFSHVAFTSFTCVISRSTSK